MRYTRKIKQLRHKEVVRIGFLVWENSKWAYESLYKKFSEEEHYQVVVMIVDNNHILSDLKKNQDFFQSRGYETVVLKSLSDFSKNPVDIVFYEQPWFALNGNFTPKKLSKFALCLYVPYAVNIDADNEVIIDKTTSFYNTLYISFMFNDWIVNNFHQYKITNMIAVGHPKMDVYLNEPKEGIWKTNDKVRIVYAPHHSLSNSVRKWATWEWNGQHILQLAQKHADKTEWIFKPHPQFKYTLSELLKSEDMADEIFAKWKKVAQVYDEGEYFDIFRTADLMISDSGSFILEWLPTGKPYIHLISKDPEATQRTTTSEHYSEQYYKAQNINELDEYFYAIVEDKRDPKMNARKILAEEIPLGASENILSFIRGLIK